MSDKITVIIQDPKDHNYPTILRRLREAGIPVTGGLSFGDKKVKHGTLVSSRILETGVIKYEWYRGLNNKDTIARVILFLPFHLFFKRLIKRNYKNRRMTAIYRKYGGHLNTSDRREHNDEWYWADKFFVKYRYFAERGL